MKKSKAGAGAARLSELLYHLSHIVEQEAALREMLGELAAPADAQQRADVLSRIEIEVIYHLGYHLKELRKPLAKELKRAYKSLAKSKGP